MAATERPPLRGASVDTRVLAVEDGVGRERRDRLAGEEPLEIRARGAAARRPVRVAVTMRTPGQRLRARGGLPALRGAAARRRSSSRRSSTAPTSSSASRPTTSSRCTCAGRSRPISCSATSASRRPAACAARPRSTRSRSPPSRCRRARSSPASVIGELPERLRAAQRTFERTGGLHATGLFTADGELHARARGRRPPQRARQGHRQPPARRRDAARRLRRARLGPCLVRARAEGRGGGHPGAVRRGRALQPRRRCRAPPRPDARRASCATTASTSTPGPRGSHSRRHDAGTTRRRGARRRARRLARSARRAPAGRRRWPPSACRSTPRAAACWPRRSSRSPPTRPTAARRWTATPSSPPRTANGVLAPGTYLRIDTGQPVDDRFDAVAQVEIASESAAGLLVERASRAGTNVRAAGEDVREGDVLLPAGRLLSSYDIALAAVAGHAALRVTRRPAVADPAHGRRAAPAGNAPRPGRGRRCRRPDAAGARARVRGADCERLPRAPRRRRADRRGRARGAAAASDLVLVIAGSSRGRADHTASVLERHGELVAHGVALRPAHPVALGVVEGTPVIGIPGYPVAAAVAFERFARPLLELLLGALPEDAPLIRVRLIGERARQARGRGLRAARR